MNVEGFPVLSAASPAVRALPASPALPALPALSRDDPVKHLWPMTRDVLAQQLEQFSHTRVAYEHAMEVWLIGLRPVPTYAVQRLHDGLSWKVELVDRHPLFEPEDVSGRARCTCPVGRSAAAGNDGMASGDTTLAPHSTSWPCIHILAVLAALRHFVALPDLDDAEMLAVVRQALRHRQLPDRMVEADIFAMPHALIPVLFQRLSAGPGIGLSQEGFDLLVRAYRATPHGRSDPWPREAPLSRTCTEPHTGHQVTPQLVYLVGKRYRVGEQVFEVRAVGYGAHPSVSVKRVRPPALQPYFTTAADGVLRILRGDEPDAGVFCE